MARSRIPEKIADFNSYINFTDVYLLAIFSGIITNRERLGLSAAIGTAWSAKRNTWNILYPLYANPDTRTKTLTAQVKNTMADFREFANPVLNLIAASPEGTEADENVFNLVLLANRDVSPTPRGAIQDVPIVSLKPMGGGRMQIKVRTNEDASHASMHPWADALEVRYLIGINDPPEGSPTPPAEGIPNANNAPFYFVSKKALFYIELGVNYSTKHMFAFVRWANTSNPAHSGPWTIVHIAVIV